MLLRATRRGLPAGLPIGRLASCSGGARLGRAIGKAGTELPDDYREARRIFSEDSGRALRRAPSRRSPLQFPRLRMRRCRTRIPSRWRAAPPAATPGPTALEMRIPNPRPISIRSRCPPESRTPERGARAIATRPSGGRGGVPGPCGSNPRQSPRSRRGTPAPAARSGPAGGTTSPLPRRRPARIQPSSVLAIRRTIGRRNGHQQRRRPMLMRIPNGCWRTVPPFAG